MFRITEVPSSGSLVQCLAKHYKNHTIVTYLAFRKTVPSYTVNYTHRHNGSEYAAITATLSMSTDTMESFL